MRMEQLDVADADKIRACHEAALAAQRVDEPEGPWLTERPFRGWLTVGWGGDPREVWLAAGREPQLERIATWNAESNEHMIAVNEAMGYVVIGPPSTWYRLDVAAVSGSPG
jgi:hypothetical protein